MVMMMVRWGGERKERRGWRGKQDEEKIRGGCGKERK
jgi:hypothetical protein